MEFNYKKVSDLKLFYSNVTCVFVTYSVLICLLLQVADYLAEKGAKTNIRNKKGRTAYEMEGMDDPDVETNDTSPNHAIRGGGRS